MSGFQIRFLHLRYYGKDKLPRPRWNAPKHLEVDDVMDEIMSKAILTESWEELLDNEELMKLFKTESPLAKGGVTVAEITKLEEDEKDENPPKYFGIAVCSKTDHFRKSTGRSYALDRAWEAMMLGTMVRGPEHKLTRWIEQMITPSLPTGEVVNEEAGDF